MMNAIRFIVFTLALGLLALPAVACGVSATTSTVNAAGTAATLTAPTGVNAKNTAEGHVIVSWDDDAAPVHRVGWVNLADYAAAKAAGDWLEAFHFADTKRNTDYTVRNLPHGQRYRFVVASARARYGSAVWSNKWTPTLRTGTAAVSAEPTRPVPAGMVKVLAPIESAVINVAESYPPQYFVHVVSGLPSGCVEFYGYEESRSGNTIKITVFNLEPAPTEPVACTADYRTHEFGVPLGTDFEPGETYTVTVNDVVTTFVAEGGPADSDTYGEVVPAPIESVAIHVDVGPEGQDYLVVEYALPNSCYELHSSEFSDEAGKFTVIILNYRTDRDKDGSPVACAEIYRTIETRLLLASEVRSGQVYEVMVNGKKRSVTATAAP